MFPKESDRSSTATFDTWARASANSSPGKGRHSHTLRSPTFSPRPRSSSTTTLAVPAVEPMITTALSASSSL